MGLITDVLIFLYAAFASFVTMTLYRDQRLQRPSSPVLTMAGWGLFSLSSTLAVLMAALAVAVAMGINLANMGLVLPTS